MATFKDFAGVPEDGLDDFHPSRTMLSATLRIDLARKAGAPTDYASIGPYDPALWAHPMVADESSTTRKWFTEKSNGRNTPGMQTISIHGDVCTYYLTVPNPLKTVLQVRGAAPREAPDPIIAHPKPIRSQPIILAGSSEVVTEPARGRKDVVGSKRSRNVSRSRSRASKIKSSEFVETDEEMQETSGRGKGRDRSTAKGKAIAKGRGKSKEVEADDGMDVDEPSSSQLPEPMNVDDPLAGPRVITKRPSAGIIRIKPVSQISATIDPKTSIDHPVAPSSGPCERCSKMKRTCEVEEESHACLGCKAQKTKCNLVPEGWRHHVKHDKSGEASTSATKKSRRATTPHGERPKTPKVEKQKMPKVPQLASSSSRSKSRARSVAPTTEDTSNSLPIPPPAIRSKPTPTSDDLGQVPSKYVYLLSREGQNVSTGIRLQTAQEVGPKDERDEKILELEKKNAEMEERLRMLMDDVSTLKNTIAMLVAGQNGHSAMIEAHRQLLSGPHAPSTFEIQNGNGSRSPAVPGPPTTTPDPVLAEAGLAPMPPDPADPLVWDHLLNLGEYGLAMDMDSQSEASSHRRDLEDFSGALR
jgi:hypothetical protein